MGRLDEAREQWREVIRVNPAYSVGHGRKVLPYKNPADLETVVDGLKKAGSVEYVGLTTGSDDCGETVGAKLAEKLRRSARLPSRSQRAIKNQLKQIQL
jgi:hypothetical protein